MSRALLIAAAVVLLATAAFHMTGWNSAAGWLDAERGRLVSLLWAAPAIDWAVVALLWIFAAIGRASALRWPVLLSALIPASVAVMLLGGVDAAHPGGYMLLVAAALACAGGWRLR